MTALVSWTRVEVLVTELRERLRAKSVRRFGMIAAVLAFLVGTLIAARQVSLPDGGVMLRPLVLLAILGIPATILLNTIEMELSARILNRSFGFSKALSTTIIASAANMLPLPGAAMVRVAGLSGLGGSLRDSGSVTLALSVMWIGVAAMFTGVFLGYAGYTGALFSLIAGTVLCGAVIWWLTRLSGRFALGLACLAVRSTLVAASVWRVALCFAAIGVPVSFLQSAIFSLSSVVGSAVSIVPAGLGVREVVSSALAPIAGLDPATAFIATAGDRLIELVILLALSVPITFRLKNAAELSER